MLISVFLFGIHGYSGIESYFFWGGTDTAQCFAYANGTATGGPDLNIAINGTGGLPSAGPNTGWFTSTVTVHTENYFGPGYNVPFFFGIVETAAGNPNSVETPSQRMPFTCTELPDPEPDPCPNIDPFNSGDVRSKGQDCSVSHSPIVIDTRGNGFHFGAPGRGVLFDLYATGNPIFIQWTKVHGDDSFLVRGINHNGLVDDGSELFGNGTLMIVDEILAPNGFVGLSQFDSYELGGNDDGDITLEDQVWGELYLWLDQNGDGVSTPNEMTPIGETIFTRFQTIPTESNIVDPAGNELRFWAWAFNESVSNDIYRMVDVFFLEVE